MDWVLENLRTVVVLVAVVVWVVRSLGKKAEESRGVSPPPAPGQGDATQADRTRQIQEEIRRRILARQRGESIPPPVPARDSPFGPPPVVIVQESEREDPEDFQEGPHVPMPSAAARERADVAQHAILEQQRRLADQLHALRAARVSGAAVPLVPALTLPSAARAEMASHNLDCRRLLRRDLINNSSVRRAVLLKEILGPPLALQPGRELPRR